MTPFLTGIGMGLAVAAPVGPIGLLCIRRALADGRATGLATGLGAATADAVYGILAAAGLTTAAAVVALGPWPGLAGGLMLIALGLKGLAAARSPRPQPAPASARPAATLAAAFASTFALTLANPMTIMTFAAMIAGLALPSGGGGSAPFLLVAGVFTGSALWWLFLVELVTRLKGRLPAGFLKAVDLVSGGVILVWGLAILAGAVWPGESPAPPG